MKSRRGFTVLESIVMLIIVGIFGMVLIGIYRHSKQPKPDPAALSTETRGPENPASVSPPAQPEDPVPAPTAPPTPAPAPTPAPTPAAPASPSSTGNPGQPN